MSNHYDWWCNCCNQNKCIYDKNYFVKLNKTLHSSHLGSNGTKTIDLCSSCYNLLNSGTEISVYGQSVNKADVLRVT